MNRKIQYCNCRVEAISVVAGLGMREVQDIFAYHVCFRPTIYLIGEIKCVAPRQQTIFEHLRVSSLQHQDIFDEIYPVAPRRCPTFGEVFLGFSQNTTMSREAKMFKSVQ